MPKARAAVPTTPSPCSRTARSARVYRKNRLPNYAVFDEQRYFIPGTEPATVEVAGSRVGLTICEDCWVEGPPASVEAAEGARADREPVGLAVSPRQGARARADVRRARPRLRHPLRLLQPGRRPGRAGLRRPQLRARPRWRADRARGAVRGGAARLRGAVRRRARSPSRCPTWPRSTAPSSSVCATTSARTGSGHVGIALSGGIDSALVAAPGGRRARRRARHLRCHALAPFQP